MSRYVFDVLSFAPPLAAAAPAWIWATLMMAGFVAVSAAIFVLARIATRQQPPAAGRERESDPGQDRAG